MVAATDVSDTLPSARLTRALGLAELVCLTLVTHGASHGWALVTLLRCDGAIGRVWPLGRALTYRTVDLLVAGGHIRREELTPGNGAARTPLVVELSGRRLVHEWLGEPIRDVTRIRCELPVKLALHAHANISPTPLLAAQRDVLRFPPAPPSKNSDLIERWRITDLAAIIRFLDDALSTDPPHRSNDSCASAPATN